MRFLNKITNAPSQRFFLTGNPGQRIIMDLRYLPTQQLWLMDIEYENFTVKGIAVLSSPNLLRNYRNIIPFGIACLSSGGLDPYFIDDFTAGNAAMYLLDSADVAAVEESFK
jgi:hypothetical protein